MPYIVELKGITKKYGKIVAVDNIDLKVKVGEFFSLLGPSGCGKTTTLRIIGGFVVQDSGTVTIDKTLMKNISPNKRDTSMVFQDLALFPHLNVRENIVYGLKKRSFARTRIESEFYKIIKLVNLEGLEGRRIAELSGGQKQRVALARSLIVNPKILLLDEPLASLDKKLRISMRKELKRIQRKTGTTFLYVTHDQSEALTMSDTLAVMKAGKIVQSGTPDDIYNNPVNKFTADFIGAGNFIKLKNIKRQNSRYVLTTERNGKILSDKGLFKYEDSSTLYFFIRPEKIKVSKGSVPQANRYKGVVRSSTFEGPDIRIAIYNPEVGELTAEIKNDSTAKNYRENDKAFFYWSYSEGIILKGD